MLSRPFELGDWVELDGEECIVTGITVINTCLRNASGETIAVPNERVANATITNRTRLGQPRLSVDVGVVVDADLEAAEAAITTALVEAEGVLANPESQVVPTPFADSAVVLECRFWIDNPSAPRRALTTATVVRETKAALEDAGVEIPYPQRELSGRAETDGFRVAPRDDPATVHPSSDGARN